MGGSRALLGRRRAGNPQARAGLTSRLDLLSWDIAVDRERKPVVIEINTYLQSLLMHQTENGPIPADIAAEWAERAPFRLVGGLLIRKTPRD